MEHILPQAAATQTRELRFPAGATDPSLAGSPDARIRQDYKH